MDDPFANILAVIEQNKAKTEAYAELDNKFQNLQESSIRQYAVLQDKDRELGNLRLALDRTQSKLQHEIEECRAKTENIITLESRLKNSQEMVKQQQGSIKDKDHELFKLHAKLDELAAKRQERKIGDDEQRLKYRNTLVEIRGKLKDLDQNITDLGKSIKHFDGKLDAEEQVSGTYASVQVENHELSLQIQKKDETLRELQRMLDATKEKMKKDSDFSSATIHQLQQQLSEKAWQLSFAESARNLGHDKMTLVSPGVWRSEKTYVKEV